MQKAAMLMLSTLLLLLEKARGVTYVISSSMVKISKSDFLAPARRIRGRDPVWESRPRTNKVDRVQVFVRELWPLPQ